ncbi:hypothetical protein [Thermoflexibacter ruber]|uniref:hypothetical protein n=1 Tax=Thermoflexibacter ruber TaxID=1003 RepID=UPI0011607A61|nr:hypothetical protein [Thermoflexibacter ruber]
MVEKSKPRTAYSNAVGVKYAIATRFYSLFFTYSVSQGQMKAQCLHKFYTGSVGETVLWSKENIKTTFD